MREHRPRGMIATARGAIRALHRIRLTGGLCPFSSARHAGSTPAGPAPLFRLSRLGSRRLPAHERSTSQRPSARPAQFAQGAELRLHFQFPSYLLHLPKKFPANT